jgi:hypothetical protein
MKKILKYFGLPLLVFSLLLLPALSVKAEGTTAVTAKVTGTKSIEASWPAVPTTAIPAEKKFTGNYYIGIGTGTDAANNDCNGMQRKTTGTSYTFSDLASGTGYVIVVKFEVVDAKDGVSNPVLVDTYYRNATAVTTPCTPYELEQTFWSLGTDELVFEWKCDGNVSYYEVEVTDSYGETDTQKVTEKKITLNTEDTKYFIIQVRAVVEMNGQKYYSANSESYRTFTQPTIKENRNGYKVAVKNKKLVVEWWQEKYSQGYEVWVATKKNGPYTKVKTINKNTTEKATIKNLNGKKFKANGKYWVTVTAFRKNAAGKTQRTSASYVILYDKGETYQTICEKVNLKK